MFLSVPALAQVVDRSDALDAADRERVRALREAATPLPRASGRADRRPQWIEPSPGETPCFVVHGVELQGQSDAEVRRFAWLTRDLGRFQDACLGSASLEALRKNLDARLADAGFVTSQVTLPAQNLASGQLRLQLHLGRIERIERLGDAAAIPSNVLTFRIGDVLNLRDIEQCIDHLSRLPSWETSYRIGPGSSEGGSVIAMAALRRKAWSSSLAVDNSAAGEYGSWQWTSQSSLDSPLGLADQFSLVIASARLSTNDERAQRTFLANYSIPWQAHLFRVNASSSVHRRPIQGLTTRFSAHGSDLSWQARWQWTAVRGAQHRWTVWGGLAQRAATSYVDDVELILQRRRTRMWETGLSGWLRVSSVEVSADLEQGIATRRDLGNDVNLEPAPLPHTRRAQIVLRRTLGDGSSRWTYHQVRLAWSEVRDPASGADLPVIGTRASVRGFDGAALLSGLRQRSLKQDWVHRPLVVAGFPTQPYLALDAAAVSPLAPGPTAWLAGAAIGVRTAVHGLAADLSLAAPLRKPQGFEASHLVAYASFSFSL